MDGQTATRFLHHLRGALLRAGEGARSTAAWHDRSRQLLDYGILGLMAVAPLVWGGRHDIGRLVFASMVALALVAWLVQWSTARKPASQVYSPSLWIPLLAALWLTLQMVPLPTQLLAHVAPHQARLLLLWNGSEPWSPAGHIHWSTLSLTPSATLVSLAVLIGYGLVFFLTLQWLEKLDDLVRLLRWIGLVGGGMALFGLLQHFTADGRFFWVYDHPFRGTDLVVCGSFINRNHFAHFVGIGAIASVTQLILARYTAPPPATPRKPSGSVRAPLWMGVIAVTSLALLLSFSRGGAAATAAGLAVVGLFAWRKKLWTPRQIGYLALAAAVVAGILSLHRGDKLIERLDDFGAGSLEQLDRQGGRRLIWAANLRAIAASWTTGLGAGSHREVAPAFLSESRPKPYTHAENGYLQIVTETGLPGTLLLIATLGLVARWGLLALRGCNSPVATACTAAVLGGLTLSALHSLVDFVWYLPGTMVLTLMLLAALCRLATWARPEADPLDEVPPTPLNRLHWSLGLGGVALVMLLPLVRPALAAPWWDEFLVYSSIQSAEDEHRRHHAATLSPELYRQGQLQLLDAKAENLRGALERDPANFLTHVRLAQTLLQQFEARAPLRDNQQSLSQLQATVTTGHFASSGEVRQWVQRAVGNDYALLTHAQYHARQAMQLCPIEGIAYVCLAHVSFLDDPTGRLAQSYLDQALRLRPYDGEVLFEYGKSQLMAGNVAAGIDAWQLAFSQPGPQRQLIIQVLAGRAPAADFITSFAPDWQTLPLLWQHYLAAGRPEDQQALLAHAKKQAEEYVRIPGHPANVYIWRALAGMYRDGGNFEEELACLEAAMQQDSSVYAIRHDLALALARSGKMREAQAHFRWCLAVHPENKAMRDAYERVIQAAAIERAASQLPTLSPITR